MDYHEQGPWPHRSATGCLLDVRRVIDPRRVQYIDGVDTCEGRLLTFSNVLHHRIGSFKPIDPSKPGHRKIVVMFLVDPNVKVISTAHVPCQRMDRYGEAAAHAWTYTPRSVLQQYIE